MPDRVYILSKNKTVTQKLKDFFPKIEEVKDPREINNIKGGVVFVNIKDYGIVPVPVKKGLFPVAIIDKSLSKTNLAAFIMRVMSKNYFEYIEYPFSREEIENIKDKVSIKEKNEEKIIYFKNSKASEGLICQYLCSIIGSSPQLKEICKLSGEVAPTDIPVLITGETGTGKELLAKGIWKLSKRADKPFIAINCAAIPENLIESELFGYEKGAFTGAEKPKLGKFEIADGGTIFLDEIGELPLQAQSKLLRVLQEGTFYRLGGSKEIKVDVRIMAATNRNLEEMVKEGKFREDLYYRLNFVHIKLPPLRERKEDIPYIVECIVNKYNKKLNKDIIGASREYIQKLKEQRWEGNIRELENVVVRSMILCRDNILGLPDIEFLEEKEQPKEIPELEEVIRKNVLSAIKNGGVRQLEEDIEKAVIKTVLDYTGHNQVKTAEILGINRATLRKKIKKYSL
ncbi:two-component system, NtrC family, nitrogen regulation response regulator GlnG [Persephonella hydrogeniphila]|uniref:Two-component system, NtrC family, nitrogen regulation response regulator GlnG n=1 Tax=Persephonella hydrogeniphila TaxID=198703 RepID=A0A285NQH5_9AQUI|nr:sigma-54 dependent transcriptional regulator [Persephonella hydrogeniphila]SNZ11468.1 two-component system, NtrC family, nitrogen regulation response regulator GlnG [Persephonella hydrogeniphila]